MNQIKYAVLVYILAPGHAQDSTVLVGPAYSISQQHNTSCRFCLVSRIVRPAVSCQLDGRSYHQDKTVSSCVRSPDCLTSLRRR